MNEKEENRNENGKSILQVPDTGMSQYWSILEHFWLYQYCPKMWYLHFSEHASVIQKLTILEHKNGLVLSNTHIQGRILGGGGFGGMGPPGSPKGRQKERKKEKEKERKREEKRGKRREWERKKGRKREQERKKKERNLNQYDERGAMQFYVQAGAPGKKTSGAPNWRRKRTRGAPCSFKCKQGLQGRKRQGRQIHREKDERCAMQFKCKQGLQGRKRQGRKIDGKKDERGAMQFQVQAGAPGKKTSGVPNWRRKGREGRHAVSSASRDSKEENVRGAKLTEKRTRGAPCSFKCKQGLQGRKRQGRQIDGETDERGAMQFKCKQGLQERKL